MHEGLRDRLVLADDQRLVVIGFIAQCRRDKLVTWNSRECGEDPPIVDPARAELMFDHLVASRSKGIDIAGGRHERFSRKEYPMAAEPERRKVLLLALSHFD